MNEEYYNIFKNSIESYKNFIKSYWKTSYKKVPPAQQAPYGACFHVGKINVSYHYFLLDRFKNVDIIFVSNE